MESLEWKTLELVVRQVQFFQLHLIYCDLLVDVLLFAASTVLFVFLVFLAWLFLFTENYGIQLRYPVAL